MGPGSSRRGGGAVGGDVPVRLDPGHSVRTVGVDDAPNFRKDVVKHTG